MNVVKISSRTVKTYLVIIEDGEVREKRYHKGRKYRVERIEVVKQDGNVSAVTLSGTVLKKDGSDSLNSASDRLYGQSEWPEWLHSIVGGLA